MINLGPYSGSNCPEVHVQPRVIDRIEEIIAFLLLITVGIVVWKYYPVVSEEERNMMWLKVGVSAFIWVLALWSSYAPVKYYNFPVRVSEKNIAVQYLLVTRTFRVFNLVFMFLMLSFILSDIEPHLMVRAGFFNLLSAVFGIIVFICLIVYYVRAYRYR